MARTAAAVTPASPIGHDSRREVVEREEERHQIVDLRRRERARHAMQIGSVARDEHVLERGGRAIVEERAVRPEAAERRGVEAGEGAAEAAATPGAERAELGLVLTLVLILVTGFVVSNVIGQAAVGYFESGIRHLPLVSLLYSSLKDLLGAFVGDKKSFDRPVMVSFDAEGKVKAFGFVTCDRFDDVRLRGFVAVYLPQAYNFAGNLMIVPKDRVEPVDAEPAQFMAFVVSGGVASMGGAKTQLDDGSYPRPSAPSAG